MSLSNEHMVFEHGWIVTIVFAFSYHSNVRTRKHHSCVWYGFLWFKWSGAFWLFWMIKRLFGNLCSRESTSLTSFHLSFIIKNHSCIREWLQLLNCRYICSMHAVTSIPQNRIKKDPWNYFKKCQGRSGGSSRNVYGQIRSNWVKSRLFSRIFQYLLFFFLTAIVTDQIWPNVLLSTPAYWEDYPSALLTKITQQNATLTFHLMSVNILHLFILLQISIVINSNPLRLKCFDAEQCTFAEISCI